MTANAWDDESLKWLSAEHNELFEVIADLRQAICSPMRFQGQIITLISKLRELVECHFLHEEQAGYLDELAEKAPRYRAQAAVLLRQHEALLEEADKLSLLARSGVESPAWWLRVEMDLQRFASRLVDHEKAEDKLVHEARATGGRAVG